MNDIDKAVVGLSIVAVILILSSFIYIWLLVPAFLVILALMTLQRRDMQRRLGEEKKEREAAMFRIMKNLETASTAVPKMRETKQETTTFAVARLDANNHVPKIETQYATVGERMNVEKQKPETPIEDGA